MSDQGTPDERIVLLPGRSGQGKKSDSPPVWSIAPDNGQNAPLSSVCDKHNRPEQICCRELKGSDERTLIDPAIVRDVIVGLSDGLTVPFALTAGLASLGSPRIVIIAGLAEIISGAISMGIGGFLASEAERDHFRFLRKSTHERVERSCTGEMEREVAEILGPVGVNDELCRRVATSLLQIENEVCEQQRGLQLNKKQSPWWRSALETISRKPRHPISLPTSDNNEAGLTASGSSTASTLASPSSSPDDVGLTAFLLKYGEGMEEVPNSRLFISAFTIAAGYAIGGIIPLLPYFFVLDAATGLYWSVFFTAIVLMIFGAFKAFYTGAEIGVKGYVKAMLSTLAVGGVAAGASFGIVRALET